MSPRKRNVITGLVVLTALGVLVWMVLLFSGQVTALFKPRGMPVAIEADRGDGLSDGSPVLFRGVRVGKVAAVRRASDNRHVTIDSEIDNDPPLPKNLQGAIRAQSALGSSAQIELTEVGQPVGTLAAGDVIRAKYLGFSILPEELTGVFSDFRQQQLARHLDETIVTIRDQAARAGKLMDSLQKIVGDEQTQQDLKSAMASVRAATARADKISESLEKLTDNANGMVGDARVVMQRTSDNVDHLTRQVGDDVDKLGKVLNQFDQIAGKINNGKGTAGALLNDPKLYDELSDTAREMKLTVAAIHRVVEQWEKEGLALKVK